MLAIEGRSDAITAHATKVARKATTTAAVAVRLLPTSPIQAVSAPATHPSPPNVAALPTTAVPSPHTSMMHATKPQAATTAIRKAIRAKSASEIRAVRTPVRVAATVASAPPTKSASIPVSGSLPLGW